MKRIFFTAWICVVGTLVWADDATKAHELNIKRSTDKILVDGILNEASWQQAEPASNFHQSFPTDTADAISTTIVKVTYDDQFLYIGATCIDTVEGDYVIESLKRDFDVEVSDAFSVYIDPFMDKNNGFAFAVNPYGAQWEGIIENAGVRDIKSTWDNKWYSKVTRHADRWVVEMAIPFKTLRYKEGIKSWGINFSRKDFKLLELTSWAPVPRNFNVANLGYTGTMHWDETPKKPGTNISIIPYGITDMSRDFEEGEPSKTGGNIGLDAKIAVTSSLNLDVTINPDFSQVDVDEQITNLTQFSLFFPEKRTFFLENSDLFNQFGFRNIRPFFSRRVGLYQGEKVPIIAGARLSGRLNENWRIGVLNLQTAEKESLDLSAQNYTLLATQRQVGANSYIAGIFVNRQGFEGGKIDGSDYNRIAGVEYRFVTPNNHLRGKIFQHFAFTPGLKEETGANASWILYSTKHIKAMWNHEYVGKNYVAETGFSPRTNYYDAERDTVVRFSYYRLEPEFGYSFFPRSSVINTINPELSGSIYYDSTMQVMEGLYKFKTEVLFHNTSNFEIEILRNTNRLFFPTNIGGLADSIEQYLPKGYYSHYEGEINYESPRGKKVTYGGAFVYGSFYNGTKLSYRASIGFRAQPWGVFELNYRRDQITLPSPHVSGKLDLIGPKIEISFTKNLFFSNFIQYNTQAENININSRFQWRFKPMSDLFIVYTDNYLPTNLEIKNRALVVKFVWWLSV